MNLAIVLTLLPVLFVITFGISVLGWASFDTFTRCLMGYSTILFFGGWLTIVHGETSGLRSRIKAMIVS